jgi:hypothetical protein
VPPGGALDIKALLQGDLWNQKKTIKLARFVWVLPVLRRLRAASPRVVIRASSARLIELGG